MAPKDSGEPEEPSESEETEVPEESDDPKESGETEVLKLSATFCAAVNTSRLSTSSIDRNFPAKDSLAESSPMAEERTITLSSGRSLSIFDFMFSGELSNSPTVKLTCGRMLKSVFASAIAASVPAFVVNLSMFVPFWGVDTFNW